MTVILALLVVAVALLLLPLYVVALAVVRLLDAARSEGVEASARLRVGPRRERVQTQAAPAARSKRPPPADPAQSYTTPHPPQTDAHPHALGTWGTTTPETGVPAPHRRTGDS